MVKKYGFTNVERVLNCIWRYFAKDIMLIKHILRFLNDIIDERFNCEDGLRLETEIPIIGSVIDLYMNILITSSSTFSRPSSLGSSVDPAA
jgi:hypothetical protein